MAFRLRTELYNFQNEQIWPKQGRNILAYFDDTSIVLYRFVNDVTLTHLGTRRHLGKELHTLEDKLDNVKARGDDVACFEGIDVDTNTLNLYTSFTQLLSIPDSQQQRPVATFMSKEHFDELLETITVNSCTNKEYLEDQIVWSNDRDPFGVSLERFVPTIKLCGKLKHHFLDQWVDENSDIGSFFVHQQKILHFGNTKILKVPRERQYIPNRVAVCERLNLNDQLLDVNNEHRASGHDVVSTKIHGNVDCDRSKQNQSDRNEMRESFERVDNAILQDTEDTHILNSLVGKPSLVVLSGVFGSGCDHHGRDNVEITGMSHQLETRIEEGANDLLERTNLPHNSKVTRSHNESNTVYLSNPTEPETTDTSVDCTVDSNDDLNDVCISNFDTLADVWVTATPSTGKGITYSNDVILYLFGSFNPVHTTHIQALVEAKDWLHAHTSYTVLAGYLTISRVNTLQACPRSDKLLFPFESRLKLCKTACDEHPWIHVYQTVAETIHSVGEKLRTNLDRPDATLAILKFSNRPIFYDGKMASYRLTEGIIRVLVGVKGMTKNVQKAFDQTKGKITSQGVYVVPVELPNICSSDIRKEIQACAKNNLVERAAMTSRFVDLGWMSANAADFIFDNFDELIADTNSVKSRPPTPLPSSRKQQTDPTHSRDVILYFYGCFNPIHSTHVRVMVEARNWLHEYTQYRVIAAYLTLTSDTHVESKTRQSDKIFIKFENRLKLCKLACAEHPWISVYEKVAESQGAVVSQLRAALQLPDTISVASVMGSDRGISEQGGMVSFNDMSHRIGVIVGRNCMSDSVHRTFDRAMRVSKCQGCYIVPVILENMSSSEIRKELRSCMNSKNNLLLTSVMRGFVDRGWMCEDEADFIVNNFSDIIVSCS